jgi:signal peptidase I
MMVSKEDSAMTNEPPIDSTRETIESVAMAIILAFMFRTFIVEAFVIPTGSMASTLQGRHMDLDCPQCGYRYQTGASIENPDTGSNIKVVKTTCPICRYTHELDKKADSNQESHTGDRILVRKFSYALKDPERWQVVVFRFPGNPKQPYIKRLVGLPGESIRITGGDIYTTNDPRAGEFTIARKPDNRLLSMLQLVHDSNYRPAVFDEISWPLRWQPWKKGGGADDDWSRLEEGNGYRSEGVSPADSYLRYNHIVDRLIWGQIRVLEAFRAAGQQGEYKKKIEHLKKKENHPVGKLILDYYAYNDGEVDTKYPFQHIPKKGQHWVGDLAGEFDVELQGRTGTLLLDLVEGGVHYQCQVDVSNGKATLLIDDGRGMFMAADGRQLKQLTGQTGMTGPGRYQLRFSNVDNELRLWVDNERIDLDGPGTYQSDVLRTPQLTEKDPLDRAPLGIGSRQLAMTVHRMKVYRDLYYVATGGGNALEFTLSEDEFFPLGDNSPESKDARLWTTDVLDEFSSDVAIKLGVRIANETGPPRIAQLMPFGGAHAVDIRPGDVILSIDGIPISNRTALLDLMKGDYKRGRNVNYRPGRTINLELDRGGETIMRVVTLGLLPSFHRDLLVGEALMIYWPHPWRVKSLPLIPHFKRMGLIR